VVEGHKFEAYSSHNFIISFSCKYDNRLFFILFISIAVAITNISSNDRVVMVVVAAATVITHTHIKLHKSYIFFKAALAHIFHNPVFYKWH
jgi:hypothetical protein